MRTGKSTMFCRRTGKIHCFVDEDYISFYCFGEEDWRVFVALVDEDLNVFVVS